MDRLEKKLIFTIVLAFGLVMALFLNRGKQSNQAEIEARALKLKNQDCYKWQDIEYIIHGETQE